MLLLANENIPYSATAWLRDAGYDVLAIGETTPGIPDTAVLQQAATEQRVILTFDRDYGELIFRFGLPVPAGIVYFRMPPTSPVAVAERLVALVAAAVPLVGMFTVVDTDHVRQRALPSATIAGDA
ncbi:DUF5615 family PIN-like protein [Herpetosiphon gulosus]|uniref:DUF5615 domain-containing protein n=1 Tax=Herpetosiphon gulosus TaxID=1973496 RepID=A0ABP9X9K9_9CHLR